MLAYLERLLRQYVPHKEIGRQDIGEEFTRFHLLRTPWFQVFLHKLNALVQHPVCHNHPWHFWAIVLWGGYFEFTSRGRCWRGPGSILYRPARFAHNVVTRGISWSLIITSRKIRSWGFLDCE